MSRIHSTFIVGAFIFGLLLQSCGENEKTASITTTGSSDSEIKTVPGTPVELQNSYRNLPATGTSSGTLAVGGADTLATTTDEEWQRAVAKNIKNIESHKKLAETLSGTVDTAGAKAWSATTTYISPGNKVTYNHGKKYGIFINSWWTKGDEPSFVLGSSSPWKIVKRTNAGGTVLKQSEAVDLWATAAVYVGGNFVKHGGKCYEARYWTKGDVPIEVTPAWKSPWTSSTKCSSADDAVYDHGIINPVSGGKPPIEQPPVVSENDNDNKGTPTIPPVIPAPAPAPAPAPPVAPITEFPADGYEFLRAVTTTHWDWLFPLRNGRFVDNGGVRNQPPIASADGSKDTFNLENFKKAVFAYNTWAKANRHKQFLNEGTKKQQAQEFIVFWAKSSRETSGSWSTAKTPWIVHDANYGGYIWKGGLYWVEEVGYSTNGSGVSSIIRYVDHASKYTPVAGRSYYGRGVIQLSWNYNYGAFSAWLYDNGLLRDVITERDTLLKRPDYVATKGDLSIMSGIWFWMTPQGAKPSSHDVLYGDVFNVSQRTQDRGLPQRNDGGTIPAASGDTTDESIMAYRLGTIINIVNGGLECNKAAKWHPGPMQRVSYFNAYTLYFNNQMSNLNATRVTAATNVWNDRITSPSVDDDLKMASCYAQKSYYGW